MYCEKCGTQINENAKFCPNCGNNLIEAQNSETIPSAEVSSASVVKKKSKCLVLSIIFAAIGIIPLLNILFLPVAVVLAIIGFVTDKNGITKTKIVNAIVVILSVVISLLWMIPAITGSPITPSNGDTSGDKNTTTTCSHSYSLKETEATCSNGGYATYQCSLCDETKREYESALGHTTTEGTCSRCGETFGTWEIAFYVDEFNNPTSQGYIRNPDVFYGTFSNSATTNSKLYARIMIDTEDVSVKLWEYGSNVVDAYKTTYYDITILDDSGNKHYTTGTMYKNGDRIYVAESFWDDIIVLLQNNEQLKIYIEEDSSGINSSYLFTVKSGNFNDIYSDYYYEYLNK